jgi:hypothetical protein
VTTLFRFEVDADFFGGSPHTIATLMEQFANVLRSAPTKDIRQPLHGKPLRGMARAGDAGPAFGGIYVTEGELSPRMYVEEDDIRTVVDEDLPILRGSPAQDILPPKERPS